MAQIGWHELSEARLEKSLSRVSQTIPKRATLIAFGLGLRKSPRQVKYFKNPATKL
jgi:hypothetical protein